MKKVSAFQDTRIDRQTRGLVSHLALRDRLAEQLRRDIESGRIKPGEMIRQEELCRKYRVSRTPVREALLQLKYDGMVVPASQGCVRVAAPPRQTTAALLKRLRLIVELHILDEVFEGIDEDDMRRMRDAVERLQPTHKQHERLKVEECDHAFRSVLVKKSTQTVLVALWSRISNGLRGASVDDRESVDDSISIYCEHRELLSLCRSRHKEDAVALYWNKLGQVASRKANGRRDALLDVTSGMVAVDGSESNPRSLPLGLDSSNLDFLSCAGG